MNEIKNSTLIYKCYQTKAPKFTPSYGVPPDMVHTITNIRHRLNYIWLNNQQEFWFFLVRHQNVYLKGYAWNSHYWIEVNININNVKSYY